MFYKTSVVCPRICVPGYAHSFSVSCPDDNKLAANMASYISNVGSVGVVTAAADHAEIVVIRTAAGVSKAYSIYLLLGGDGIWRIESM